MNITEEWNSFKIEFDKLHYQWSDSNQEKAFLGWRLARLSHAVQSSGNSGEVAQGAKGEAIAWLDPDTQDAITDQRKKDWESNFGAGGIKKASAYTVPLYTHPAERAAAPEGSFDFCTNRFTATLCADNRYEITKDGVVQWGRVLAEDMRLKIETGEWTVLSAAPTLAGKGGAE
jgi:hypothetical protein